MVDLSAISSALASFKAAKDIAESMIGLRDAVAFQGKLIEFQSKIIDANNAAFAAQEERSVLLQQIRELEEKVANFAAWETEKQRYELTEVGTNRGVFAYALKEGIHPPEPAHYLCTNCFQERHKSILQQVSHFIGRAQSLNCPRCGAEIYTQGQRHSEHATGHHRRN